MAEVNRPLLIPDFIQGDLCDCSYCGGEVRATEGSKAVLGFGACIGHAGVERRPDGLKDEEGGEVCLEEHVDVRPGGESATIVKIPIYRIGYIRDAGRDAVLNVTPGGQIAHVIEARQVGDVLLVNR